MNHLKDQKDETLVDLTLLGNDAAYEELVIRYGKLVNSVAYRITGNKYSAEDAESIYEVVYADDKKINVSHYECRRP